MCLSRQRGEAIPRTPTRGVSTMVHDVKERLEGRSVRLASRRCAFTVCNNCRCDASDFLRGGRFLLGPPRQRTRKRICPSQRKAFSFNDMQGSCQLAHCSSTVTIVSMHARARCSTWNNWHASCKGRELTGSGLGAVGIVTIVSMHGRRARGRGRVGGRSARLPARRVRPHDRRPKADGRAGTRSTPAPRDPASPPACGLVSRQRHACKDRANLRAAAILLAGGECKRAVNAVHLFIHRGWDPP